MSFDLDGTLVDRDGASARWWAARLPDVDPALFEALVARDRSGGAGPPLFRWACEVVPSLAGADPESLRRVFLDEIADHVQPDLDVIALVERVRAKYEVAVLTNGGSVTQRAKIAASGLALHFPAERVVVSQELGVGKPDPAAFARVVEVLGVPASACLHVGDRANDDVLGALGAGLQACLVGTWTLPEPPVPGVDCIPRITALPTVLPC